MAGAQTGHGLLDRPYALLLLTTLFWAGNAVAGKFAVGQIDAVLLTVLRWLFGALCFAWLARGQLRRDWPLLRAQLPLLLALGATGYAGFNLFLYSSLHHTSAIHATIEQASIPMLILLFNRGLFGQRILPLQYLALALATAGVVITVARGDLALLWAGELNRGDGMMLIACLCYAGYSVGLRFKPAVHWSGLMLVMAVGALLASLPVLGFRLATVGVAAPTATGWAVAAFAVVFPTVCAQLFFLRAVGLIGSSRAGLFINLVPVFAAALAVALLGEQLRAYHVLGLGLVLVGIGLSERVSKTAGTANS